MTDKSKPFGHLESLLEETRYRKIEHYRQSHDHKLQGDVLAMVESDMIDVLSAERNKATPPSEDNRCRVCGKEDCPRDHGP